MFRLISSLIYFFTGQAKRESMDYFWTVYEKVKNGKNRITRNIYGCILHRLYRENCANIPIETQFEGYPFFPHGISGVYISQGAKIGAGCTIFHQVTIGSNTLKDSKGFGAPDIGEHVYIGAGAKIIGNVRVGNHCRIGANCVVTTDVPDNATVVLSSPKMILHEECRNNVYQNF